jgi:hypothetical protein
MTLRLPIQKAKNAGLRPISSKDEFENVLQILTVKSKPRRLMWSRRAQEYENNEAGYGAINNGIERGGNDIHKSAWFSYLKYRDPCYIGLPEELKEMDFHRPGYKYTKTYDTDENGDIIHFYPAFVETESDINFVDDVNDIQSETGSETTEVLW